MAVKIKGEISATNYKRLVAKLHGCSKRQLWKILDHYIFHVIQDQHVEELLKILDEQPTQQVTAATETSLPERIRPLFRDTVATADLAGHRDLLDLLYDPTYFSYLEPAATKTVAQKLVAFAAEQQLPAQPHWTAYAEAP